MVGLIHGTGLLDEVNVLSVFNDWMWESELYQWAAAMPDNWLPIHERIDPDRPGPTTDDEDRDYLREITLAVIAHFHD